MLKIIIVTIALMILDIFLQIVAGVNLGLWIYATIAALLVIVLSDVFSYLRTIRKPSFYDDYTLAIILVGISKYIIYFLMVKS